MPPGAADDLDTIDVFQQCVLRLPKDTGKKRRVNTAAVDQDEHRAGKTTAETTDADRPTVAVDTAHRHARSQSQSFGDAGHTRPMNFRLGDDVYGRRGICDFLLFFCHRGNFKIGQLFEAQLFQDRDDTLRLGGGIREAKDDEQDTNINESAAGAYGYGLCQPGVARGSMDRKCRDALSLNAQSMPDLSY